MEEQQVTSGSVAQAVDLVDTKSSLESHNQHRLGTREDVALSSDSGRDGCPSEHSEFSCDEDRDAEGFASRREFSCFGYLYGRARVRLRQYDITREAENSFHPTEKLLARWRL